MPCPTQKSPPPPPPPALCSSTGLGSHSCHTKDMALCTAGAQRAPARGPAVMERPAPNDVVPCASISDRSKRVPFGAETDGPDLCPGALRPEGAVDAAVGRKCAQGPAQTPGAFLPNFTMGPDRDMFVHLRARAIVRFGGQWAPCVPLVRLLSALLIALKYGATELEQTPPLPPVPCPEPAQAWPRGHTAPLSPRRTPAPEAPCPPHTTAHCASAINTQKLDREAPGSEIRGPIRRGDCFACRTDGMCRRW